MAAPAYDITHYRSSMRTVDGGCKETRRSRHLTVKFRQSKYLKEVRYIPRDNVGKRVDDYPNEGKSITDFRDYFKSIEYSNACAIAKARLINISREAHQFRRRVYRYSLPENSVIFWEGEWAYLLDSVPPVAAEFYRIPKDQIPRVNSNVFVNNGVDCTTMIGTMEHDMTNDGSFDTR